MNELEKDYWKMVYNRQLLFHEKQLGLESSVVDPVLIRFKFTNMYRILDRTTQYLLKEVINKGSEQIEEVFYRVFLFKLHNTPLVWEILCNEGYHELGNFDFEKMSSLVLDYKIEHKVNVYSSAYCTNWGSGKLSHYSDMTKQHFYLLKHILQHTSFFSDLNNMKTLKKCGVQLKKLPMIGSFISYQLCLDLSYHSIIPFEENESNSVVIGPGANKGLIKIFGSKKKELLYYLHSTQRDKFSDLDLNFPYLVLPNGEERELSISDIEHTLCEYHKYKRYQEALISGRKIGKVYKPKNIPLEIEYPRKWYR
ncbi:MAG: putative DNA base hypermodification protein [Nitrososphaeraceae archaeon]|nr:putative DNA base hypermodification protein [Nitrososphaeraceae archaeon]